jgi:hypothetical protein
VTVTDICERCKHRTPPRQARIHRQPLIFAVFGRVSRIKVVLDALLRFTTDRLERLERSLVLALNQEWPQLSTTQKRLAKIRPTPIRLPDSASPLTVVATVATDGGENRLSLEPIQVQVIRVADSLGEIYFEDFIAQSLTPEEILRFFFQSNRRLQRFLTYHKVDGAGELAPHSAA